jgi:hypothetical protein
MPGGERGASRCQDEDKRQGRSESEWPARTDDNDDYRLLLGRGRRPGLSCGGSLVEGSNKSRSSLGRRGGRSLVSSGHDDADETRWRSRGRKAATRILVELLPRLRAVQPPSSPNNDNLVHHHATRTMRLNENTILIGDRLLLVPYL